MPEPGLAFDDSMFDRSHRPSLNPFPPPAELTACPDDAVAGLRVLDELLIQLLLDWTDQARDHQLARRAAGLSAISISWENATVDRYASCLGRPGARIALALLALSRDSSGRGVTRPHPGAAEAGVAAPPQRTNTGGPGSRGDAG